MRTTKKILAAALLTFSFPVLTVGQIANEPGSGNALEFSDGNYVQVGTNASLRPTGALSLTAWVYYTGSGADTDHILSNDFPDASPSGYALGLVWGTPDDLTFATYDGSGADNLTVNGAITNNKWYHIAAIWDGSTKYIYINGVLAGSKAWSGPISYADDPTFRLGMAYNPGTDPDRAWVGFIDEITVWDTALSQTEIQQNMTKKLTGTEPGLLGYWRLDEGSGNTAFDSSPNGNDGTLQ